MSTTHEPLTYGERQREEVASLRLSGLTNAQIARRMGISPQRVGHILRDAREHWRENLARTYEDHVAQELARYQQLEQALGPAIVEGDPTAVGAAMRIADRRAKLLGLDFNDRTNAKAVEVEAAKVRVMGMALVSVLSQLGLDADQQAQARHLLASQFRKELAPGLEPSEGARVPENGSEELGDTTEGAGDTWELI